MDCLALASASSRPFFCAASISVRSVDKTAAFPSTSHPGRRTRTVCFRQKQKLLVFAYNEPELDKRLQMELKFRFIGEDSKLTPPKVQVKATSSVDGLNLVAPVPKRGVKYEYSNEPSALDKRKPSLVVGEPKGNGKISDPSVILRKPTVSNDEGVEEKPPGWGPGTNSSLKTSNAQSAQRFNDIALSREHESKEVSDFTQLKRPEAVQTRSNLDMENEQYEFPEVQVNDNAEKSGLRGTSESRGRKNATNGEIEKLMGSIDKLLLPKQSYGGLKQVSIGSTEVEIFTSERSASRVVYSCSGRKFSVEATPNGKPKGFDQFLRETSETAKVDTGFAHPAETGISVELESSLAASPSEDLEDAYWARAEELLEKRKWERVELISVSTRGFVVSFGPLVGFLPYNNLSARWSFLAFEPWLRSKGLDPSSYREKLQIIRSYDTANMNSSPKVNQKVEGVISPDMHFEDLVKIYDQEKIKFLSSCIGQAPGVCVVMADRKSRKLIFSLKPRTDEELVEKKRSLMAKLQIGDVMKCRITKIAYYGVFVEVEEVPALIHYTEVSWDATSDPSSLFKIGQILEAKVHKLNFDSERIFLSLKGMMPNPSSHTLEMPVDDSNPSGGRLQAAEEDVDA